MAPGLAGCAAGVLFLCLMLLPFLFILAWSEAHCEPVPACQRRSEIRFALEAGVAAAVAAAFGLAVRALVRWGMERARDRKGAGRPPAWAVAVVAVLGAFVLALAGPMFV